MDGPSWADFEETPVPEFRPRPPHAELADVLARYRADLDAAARSAAAGRAQTLRALAEQAVLAVELEGLVDRAAASANGDLLVVLRQLKDRMLDRMDAAGLEIVHVLGATADAVADIVEIEHWRFADSYPAPIVAEELEVAIKLNGAPLRKGRVVMGAPRGHSVGRAIELAGYSGGAPAAACGPHSRDSSPAHSRRIVCPVHDCGTENELDAAVCVGCLTTLVGYRRLALYPDVLFNRGLLAARAGDIGTARECFAAVALWLPEDARARNAYALACLEAGDVAAARRSWRDVLAFAPDDPVARRGLEA